MKLKKTLAVLGAFAVGAAMLATGPATHADEPDPADSAVVTVPKTIPSTTGDFETSEGTWTPTADTVVIRLDSMATGAQLLVDELNAYLDTQSVTGATEGATEGAADDSIMLIVDTSRNDLEDEGYELTITTEGVTIIGKTEQGVFWGTRTLSQMLRQQLTLPAGTVTDVPAYQERGATLCACQINISTDWIDRFLTEMADLKMNTVLMEMKLKSDEYPDANTWSYYTRDDVKEFVEKADAYGIDVIPEINSPGHMNIWLENLPQFQLANANGVKSADRLDITNLEAVAFYKTLIDEYDGVFSTDYWHMGADEYMMGASYNNYPQLAEYAQEVTGDDNATGADAFTYFINDINDYVKSKGKTLRIWNDGIVETTAVTLDKDIVIEHWLSSGRSASDLLDDGYKMVNANSQLYFARATPYPIQANGPASLYGTWSVDDFAGSSNVGEHDNLLGAKLSIWPDNGVKQTENEVEADIYEAMRYVAQMTWAGQIPEDNPTYDSFKTNRIDAIGRSPMWNNVERKPLENGTYTIRATKDEQSLKLTTKAGLGGTDEWTLTATPDHYYQLKNLSTNKCLSVVTGDKHLSTVTQVGVVPEARDCVDVSVTYTGAQTGNDGWAERNPQKWQLIPAGEDTFQIRNAVTLQTLAVATGDEDHVDFSLHNGEERSAKPSAGQVVQLPSDMTQTTWTIQPSARAFQASATASSATTYAGDEGSITLTVTVANVSEQPLSNVTVTAPFKQGWTIADNSKTIESIPTGQSAEVAFTAQPTWFTGEAEFIFSVSDGTTTAEASASVTAVCGPAVSPTAVAASSQHPGDGGTGSGTKEAAVDGDPATYWHTQWSAPKATYPHTIDLQVGEEPVSICGFVYTGRSGTNPNGRVKDFELYTSDDGTTWSEEPVFEGTMADTADPQTINLEVTTKFIRLKGLNVQSSSGDADVMSAAELQVIKGTTPDAPTVATPTEPTYTDNSYTIPAIEGVQYLVDGKEVAAGKHDVSELPVTLKFTAEPETGFMFADSFYDANGEFIGWSHEFGAVPPVTPTPTPTDNTATATPTPTDTPAPTNTATTEPGTVMPSQLETSSSPTKGGKDELSRTGASSLGVIGASAAILAAAGALLLRRRTNAQ